jgi:2-keto-4-pentenoate hydratase/2-oxohepta-3-ene-1,7-dioic acid hydratase in catechol pathway
LKLAMYRRKRESRLGIVWAERIIDFNLGDQMLSNQNGRSRKEMQILDMKDFFTRGPAAIRKAKRIESWVKKQTAGTARIPAALRELVSDLSKVKILTPLSNPSKLMGLARNYVSHAREVAGDTPLPEDIMVFMKPLTAIIGPGDEVVVPADCKKLDHEVELAVVIGKKGRYIPKEKSIEHVAGYTILNDMSDREYIDKKVLQRVNWFFMKAQDTSAPVGPYLVLKDEIEDPQNLRLRLWVNGELRQDGSTQDMIFKISEIIARISHFVTLGPGDLIATGTPSGTSFSTKQYLKAWDVMECEIEGIGVLKNAIRHEKPVYRWK